jgi:hypothetical protein
VISVPSENPVGGAGVMAWESPSHAPVKMAKPRTTPLIASERVQVARQLNNLT